MQLRSLAAWLAQPLARHRGALVAMNLVYASAYLLGVAYTYLGPQAHEALLREVQATFSTTGPFGPLVRAYVEERLATAIVTTFLVNLVLGSLVTLTVPSLVIPFAGLVMGAVRALTWGILFSPVAGELDLRLLPAVPFALIEGEAYVVAMLGVWLWWWPVVRVAGHRRQAWRRGLLLQARIYAVVALFLALAAVLEALVVIYLMPKGGA